MQTKDTNNESSVGAALVPPASSVQTKVVAQTNKAVKLWFAVLCTVLAVLFIETRNSTGSDYNLVLNGDSEVIGAEVFVDGSSVGTMRASSAIGGSVCRTKVTDGIHLIDVKRRGFKPFHQEIKVRGQAYVGVEMTTGQNQNNDSDKGDASSLVD